MPGHKNGRLKVSFKAAIWYAKFQANQASVMDSGCTML
jgi:hypothetical protein